METRGDYLSNYGRKKIFGGGRVGELEKSQILIKTFTRPFDVSPLVTNQLCSCTFFAFVFLDTVMRLPSIH